MKFLCKQRILVVDDDPLNLFAISHNLKMAIRDMGHDQTIIDLVLDTASFGEQAVEMFKTQLERDNPYVVIFMDCSMEPMDGYTATSLIKQHCLEMEIDGPYIVACTGHSEAEYIQKAWKHGFDELIPKPCKIEELARVLAESMEFLY